VCQRDEDHVTSLLRSTGVPSIDCQAGDALHGILATHGFQPIAGRLVAVQHVSDRAVSPTVTAVVKAAVVLVARSAMRFATFGYATWPGSDRAVLRSRTGESIVYLDARPHPDDHLLIHVHHPLIEKLATLGQTDLDSAAHLLSRAICLRQGVAPSLAERLVGRTLGSRRG
jgi:hypothetical protein